MDSDLQYAMSPARYAKGKLALRIPGVGMWKSLAALILTNDVAPNVRFSNRESAYIVSNAQYLRFVQAVDAAQKRRDEIRFMEKQK